MAKAAPEIPTRILRSERVNMMEKRQDIIKSFHLWSVPLLDLTPTITSDSTYVEILLQRCLEYHLQYGQVYDLLLQSSTLSLSELELLRKDHELFISEFRKIRNLIQSWKNKNQASHNCHLSDFEPNETTPVSRRVGPPIIPPRSIHFDCSPTPASTTVSDRRSNNPFLQDVDTDSLWWDTQGHIPAPSPTRVHEQVDPFYVSLINPWEGLIEASRNRESSNPFIDQHLQGSSTPVSSVGISNNPLNPLVINAPFHHSQFQERSTPLRHNIPLFQEDLPRQMNNASNLLPNSSHLNWFDGHAGPTATNAPEMPHQNATPLSNSNNDNRRSPAFVDDTKIERLQMPIFKGEILDFPGWWNMWYVAYHTRTKMSKATKLQHLLRKVEGPAKTPIMHLPITDNAYDMAIDVLFKRFYNREKIIIHHVSSLLMAKILPDKVDAKTLRSCSDEVGSHIRALQSLNVDLSGDTSTVLAPMIYSRLPNDIRNEWANDAKGRPMTVFNVLGFLENAAENRDRSEQIQIAYPSATESGVERTHPKRGSILLNNGTPVQHHPPCPACHADHHPKNCSTMKKLPAWKRLDLIKESKRCTKCLGPHLANKCVREVLCTRCENAHNSMLCVSKQKKNSSSKEADIKTATATTTFTSCSESSSSILFQTAKIKVSVNGRSVVARCMFDLASNHSYATSSIVKKLRAVSHGTEFLQIQTFGGKIHTPCTRSKYFLTLNSVASPNETGHEIEVLESQHICRDIPTVSENTLSRYPHLQDLVLADFNTQISTIDLLIGLDFSPRFLKDRIVRGINTDSPIAQETVFGYVVFGRTSSPSSDSTSKCFFTNAVDHETVNEDLSNFFRLESLGIQQEVGESDSDVLNKFKSSITFTEGRYEVHLPWKDDHPSLGESFKPALQILKGLQKRFQRDPWLENKYRAAFEEYVSSGFIEKVPTSEYRKDDQVYYIPHHPVIKPEKETTKVRPVFNGSQKSKSGASLNDCLHTGSKLGSELFDILLRFRTKKVAFTSDLKKAFLQVQIHPSDRDVLRFLWMTEDGFLETWRFKRVPFGLVASSFLLSATIQFHLEQQSASAAVLALQNNLYVDDFDHTENNVEDAHSVAIESIELFKKAGMDLRQFTTSDPELRHHFNMDKIPMSEALSISKPLGIIWNLEHDTIGISPIEVQCCKAGELTKRSVLSLVSKVYDPLGLVAPLIIPGKILLQKIWTINLDWDDPIPQDLSAEARICFEYFSKIPEFSFPRSALNDESGQSIHVFTDASPEAYGSAIYICSSNGCSLFCAKSRVAPIKKLTLPRLELVACLIGSRLLNRVRQQVPHLKSSPYYIWCDSTIALCWITKPPANDIFVRNRVQEIRSIVPDLSCFQHIPGVSNPADLLTRQNSAVQFLSNPDFWKYGPDWLLGSDWPTSPIVRQPESTILTVVTEEPPDILRLERHSSLRKLLGVIAYVFRFKNREFVSSAPSIDELDKALTTAIKIVQKRDFPDEYKCLEEHRHVAKDSPLSSLHPVLGEDGVIRSIGRTERSTSLSPNGLVILPSKSRLSHLIILDCHVKEFHSGVDYTLASIRSKYWILKGRQSVKSTLRNCFHCRRFHSAAFKSAESALPDVRVNEAVPFSKVGVDNFGPYNIRDGSLKVYGLVFSCCVTRAIVLEVVPDLSSTSFLLAFRRVQARFGDIEVISDNARCFQKSAEILIGKVQWRFIPDRSPHWGGFYERMVGVAKNCIKKAVGKCLLSHHELSTLFVEVEGVVNRRPLTYIGDDPSNPVPLRPIDLLRPSISLSWNPPATAKDLRKGYGQSRVVFTSFWNKWRMEYLPLLRKWRMKDKQTSPEPVVGEVVQLFKENTKNKFMYPLGIIDSLIRGKDGKVRAAFVRTKGGKLRRSIHLLYPLEISPTSVLPPIDPKASDSISDPCSSHIDASLPLNPSGAPYAPVKSAIGSKSVPNSGPKICVTKSGRQIRRPRRYED